MSLPLIPKTKISVFLGGDVTSGIFQSGETLYKHPQTNQNGGCKHENANYVGIDMINSTERLTLCRDIIY